MRGQGAAVARGPVVSRMIQQLLADTAWGECDFLVLDMPPGTGDIQLTLCQTLKISSAVMVTTPHKLAYIDVVKGIEMFEKLSVPTSAIVENMAYFTCIHGTRHEPFGAGHTKKLQERLQRNGAVVTIARLPISQECALSSEIGRPYILAEPQSEISATFRHLADAVSSFHAPSVGATTVEYDKKLGVLHVTFSSNKYTVSPAHLRRQCKCAMCVDEISGKRKLDYAKVPEDIEPLRILPVGHYAVSIAWSDGHMSSIYPFRDLEQIVQVERLG